MDVEELLHDKDFCADLIRAILLSEKYHDKYIDMLRAELKSENKEL